MTRRRWIADEAAGDVAALTGQNAMHLARVLRARVGQEFDIAAGERVRRGRIISVAEDRVELALGNDVAACEALPITLYLAIFKFDRFEWAVEKCTELAVARIIPIIARRTEAHLVQASVRRIERWRKIAREAAQQARTGAAPEIAEPMKLKAAIQSATAVRIVLAENERQVMLRDVLASEPLSLAIGPEGGWTPEELAQFDAAGWKRASLGETILRAETAAIAAMAVAAAFGE
ncbi:MAG TPA: RsmE family RNA methyltransferase [Candidatus Koribacter sp.]|jgi:16S rRNA (uracil1498-N3)-methyltransferase